MSGFLTPPTFTPPVPPIPLGPDGQVLTMVSGIPQFAAGSVGGFIGAYLAVSMPAIVTDDFNPGGSPAWPGTLSAPYGRLDVTSVVGAADWTLNGLLAGLDGQQVILRNVTNFVATLGNQAISSAAANRFAMGANLIIGPGRSVAMAYYAGTVNRWIVQT